MKSLTVFFVAAIFLGYSCSKSHTQNGNITVIIKDSNNLITLNESDYRPFYHFTPQRNWMNDPNGLMYYKGSYHLFYQYNPSANVWGPMNWGHAVSTDLFKWRDLPIALTPDNLGTIFSGSAVVDSNNTSGFKNGNESPLVAIFTHNGSHQMQSIAYSTDAGITWNKYAANPVISNPGLVDFRDPKVFWYAALQEWILVLAAGDRVKIYSSTNLKDWTFTSDFGVNIGAHTGVWECPDLFQLPVEGTSATKWVLLVSLNGGPNGGTATQYFVGDFDGKNFTNSNNSISWIDYGTDNYAGATYNNIPMADGRRIFIGWMSNWAYAQNVPTTTWRSTMTTPRELSLANGGSGYVLKSAPATELLNLKNNLPDTAILNPVKSLQLKDYKVIQGGSYEVDFTADLNVAGTMSFSIGNAKEQLVLTYDKGSSNLILDRSVSGHVDFNSLLQQKIYCPFTPNTGQQTSFQILVDKTSMEVFVDHGNKVITALFFPLYQYDFLKLSGDGVSAAFTNFTVNSISKSMLR